MARNFEAKDAIQARNEKPLPLLLGITGPSSSGKTYSALRLATGIQSVVGGDIYGIDTEQRRMLRYADKFKFKHVEFGAPYGSLDYLDALRFAKKQGAGVAIVDSCSLEHEGPGGLLDQHEKELDRMAGNDWKRRERVAMLAWTKPKAGRRALVTAITSELSIPVIFCFRAKQGTKPIKNAEGKTEAQEQGYTLVGGEDWMFELGFNALLLPGSEGVPTWRSKLPGEVRSIKMPSNDSGFSWLPNERGPFSEDWGRKLAQMASGNGSSAVVSSKARQTPQEYAEELLANIAQATDAATLDNIERKAQKALAKMSEDDSLKSLHDGAIKAFADKRQEFVGSSDPFAVQD